MNELIFNNYTEYKQKADAAMQRMAEDFVEVGYILRQAKERPELLEGSGYRDYKEFAQIEYGLEETTVSRFININIKYGDGPALLPQYRGYGRAKLQDMLTLPDAVVEEIPKESTRAEIGEIKKDVEEAKKVTPLEAMIDEQEYDDNLTLYQNFMIAYFHENKEAFLRLRFLFAEKMGDMPKAFVSTYMPAGSGTMRAKVKGKGKFMLTVKGADRSPVLTNMRTEEKLEIAWEDAVGDIVDLDWEPTRAGWEAFYKEPWQKEEIAPVQERIVPDFMHEPETVEAPKPARNISAFPEKRQISGEKRTNPGENAQIEKVTGEVVDRIDSAPHAASWQPDAAKTQQAQEGATGQQVPEEATNTQQAPEEATNTQQAPEEATNTQQAPEEAANTQQAPEEATGQQAEEDPFFIVKGLRGKIYTLEAAMNEGNIRIIRNIIPEMIEGLKTVERLTTGI